MTRLPQAITVPFHPSNIFQHTRSQTQHICPKTNGAQEIAWPINAKAGNTLAGIF
jgi:hypothetical protein